MAPRGVQAGLPPPADLVESDRGERADQREAGDQREEQRQGVGAGRPGSQHDADNGIDHAQEHDVRRLHHEIVDAAPQRVEEVRNADLPEPGVFLDPVGACKHVKSCHDHFPPGQGPGAVAALAVLLSGVNWPRKPRPAPTLQ